MKQNKYKLLIAICIVQIVIIGGYITIHSRFYNVNHNTIAAVGTDYCVQLSSEGILMDKHQFEENRVISNHITRYILTTAEDFITSEKYNVLIAMEENHGQPAYIIYDEMIDGYVYVNKSIEHKGYWIGGLQSFSKSSEKLQKRYKKIIDKGNWINISPGSR